MNNKFFIDWESHVFGFGYGTGEMYTLCVLKTFLQLCNGENDSYNYEVLEHELGTTVVWLMINILCHADIIEYGTSPRFAWLSEKGKLLKNFIREKSLEELYEMVNVDQEYIHCYPDYCNCDLPKGVICNNPLFKNSHAQ